MTEAADSDALPLPDDEVHVWHFPYRRAEHRAPLLALLSRYLGVPDTEVHLVEGGHGRPSLDVDGDPPLHFNWSHGSDHAAIALARHVVPGIDLETVRPRENALELARRFFHPAESAALAALPVSARTHAFLQLWTAKEAVLKATGRGIAFGLHRLRIDFGTALRLTWLDGSDALAWQLQQLDLGAGHVAAIAWCGSPLRVSVYALAGSPYHTSVTGTSR